MARKAITDRERIKVLKRIRELIKNNWIKGTWHRSAGWTHPDAEDLMCLNGACNLAATEVLSEEVRQIHAIPKVRILNGRIMNMPHSRQVSRVLSLETLIVKETGRLSSIDFNDAAETTKEDVLKIVDKRIRQLQKKVK
jgi:hypothetical protein